MNFQDIFKSSFLENVTSISILDMVIALVLAFGIGMYIPSVKINRALYKGCKEVILGNITSYTFKIFINLSWG